MTDAETYDETVPCPECGGTAHRLNRSEDPDREPDEVFTFRCADCGERWDFVGDEDAAGR